MGRYLYFLKLCQQACTQGAYFNFVVSKQQPHHAVKVSFHLVSEGINMFVLCVSTVSASMFAKQASAG